MRNARGRSIHVEVVGEPDDERILRRHRHIFRFAGEVEVIDHTHEVMANRDHIHRLSKATSWSRFYTDDDS